MARRSVEVRREQILAATVAQIERAGLAQTRVADVASALDVSTALVFYHFGTKDALLAAAFEHAVEHDLERLDKALVGSTDPVDRLRRIVRLYGPTGTAVGWKLWIDAWALAQREPAIRPALRALDRRWASQLLSVVTAGVAAGAFDTSDPAASVARISALLDGLSVAALVYGTVSRRQLRAWIAEAVAAELGVDVALLH
ncbi:MAG: TetR/AcrR family transcriptional regulator [Nocardioidaceae bacterium]